MAAAKGTRRGAAAGGRAARSMTGFGTASATLPGMVVEAEIRTLNHRFLTFKPRLPASLASLEPELEERVRRHVRRGVVHLAVRLEQDRDAAPIHISHERAARYVRGLRRLATELDLPNTLDLRLVASLPGVVEDASAPGAEPPSPALAARVLKVAGQALEALARSREREGEKLRRDLMGRRRKVERLVRSAARRAPLVVRAYRDRLEARLAELLRGRAELPSEADLAREVALFAERCDVTEEITRLLAHLTEMDRILGAGEDLGRTLEFLLQEMHREVNTVGSKAQDAAISHLVVSIKGEMEKMREQVQNLE